MVLRYSKLEPFLDDVDDDGIDACMPTRREEAALAKLLEKLKELESASKRLQGPVTLLEVRDLFDALIERHPRMAHHLAPDADVVHSPAFENACVAVLGGRERDLTSEQHGALTNFRTTASRTDDQADDELGFAKRVLRERKRARLTVASYRNLDHVPPTSNVVERLFSQAKHVLGQHRLSMLPINLENILFLKFNRRFWSAAVMAEVVHAADEE